MGRTELDRFSKADRDIAAVAKALAHPARVAIMRHLANTHGCVCGDLVDVLPLAQSTVSQHLVELRKAGLIDGEVDGASVCYCVNLRAWQKASALLQDVFVSISQRCC